MTSRQLADILEFMIDMKKEDYVSIEEAKLLREKGFNEFCGAYYHLSWGNEATEDECFEVAPSYDFKNSDNTYRVGAPTLYEAQQWLWNKYKLLVTAFLEAPFGKPYNFIYCIQDAKNSVDNNGTIISDESFDSLQKALNAGLLEALKNIDDEKEITKKD